MGLAWLTGSSRFLPLFLVAHEEVSIVNAAFLISRANVFSLQMNLDAMRPFLVAGAIYFDEADLAIDGDTSFTNNSAASDGGESVHSSACTLLRVLLLHHHHQSDVGANPLTLCLRRTA